ncbi:MAG TPA: hypothetical protein VGS19_01165 [Streptosporangiaceae bacterium]|nr:hypothetical protein [Streptosporangiaceae bacterium]
MRRIATGAALALGAVLAAGCGSTAGSSVSPASVNYTYNPDISLAGGPGTVTFTSSVPLRQVTYELWRENDITSPLDTPDKPFVTATAVPDVPPSESFTVTAPIPAALLALGPSDPRFIYTGTNGVGCLVTASR